MRKTKNRADPRVAYDRADEAIGHYTEVLQLKPDFAAARNNLKVALYVENKKTR